MVKYVVAGLAALVVYHASGLLLPLLEEHLNTLTGWPPIEPMIDVRWLRAAAGMVLAACLVGIAERRRNLAALRWRKELVARARA